MATVINLPKDPREEVFGDLAKSFGTFLGNKEAKKKEEEEFKELIETFSRVSDIAKKTKSKDAVSVINEVRPKDLAVIRKATKGDPVKMMQFFEKATVKANKKSNKKAVRLEVQPKGKPGDRVTITIPPEISDDQDKIKEFVNKRGYSLVRENVPKQVTEEGKTISDWIKANKKLIDPANLTSSESRNAARLATGVNRNRILTRLGRSVASDFNQDNQPIWGEAERKGMQVANSLYDTLVVLSKGNESRLEELWTQVANQVAGSEQEDIEEEAAAAFAPEEESPGVLERIGNLIGIGDDEEEPNAEDISEEQKKNLRFKHEGSGKTFTWADVEETARAEKITPEEVLKKYELKRIK